MSEMAEAAKLVAYFGLSVVSLLVLGVPAVFDNNTLKGYVIGVILAFTFSLLLFLIFVLERVQ